MNLAERSLATAQLFRLARDPEGHQQLAEVCAAIEQALGEGRPVPGATAPVLTTLVNAQERGDLLLVADLLEYVLVPSLRR